MKEEKQIKSWIYADRAIDVGNSKNCKEWINEEANHTMF